MFRDVLKSPLTLTVWARFQKCGTNHISKHRKSTAPPYARLNEAKIFLTFLRQKLKKPEATGMYWNSGASQTLQYRAGQVMINLLKGFQETHATHSRLHICSFACQVSPESGVANLYVFSISCNFWGNLGILHSKMWQLLNVSQATINWNAYIVWLAMLWQIA